MTTFSLSARRSTRNIPPAFFAGVLLALTEAILNPIILLVFFVGQLTDSLKSLALVLAVSLLGWFLPQLFVPWLTRSASRQMPWALGASIVRAASVVFLAYLGFKDNITDDERLRSFFICFIAYSVASGFAQSPVNELIARSLPSDRRAAVIRQRNLWGGLLAIGAGLVTRQALGAPNVAFPRDLSLMFVAAAAGACGATYFLARITEAPSVPEQGRHRSTPRLSDLDAVLSDGAFRRYVFVGMMVAVSVLADPFYVAYAQRTFKLPADMIGTFLALFAAGALLSSPFWAFVERTSGARGTIQTAIAIRVIAPLTVLLLPTVIDTELYRDHVSNDRVVFYILAVPFVVIGISARGFMRGNFRYVMDIALPQRHAAYQLLALTPMLVAAAAPFAGVELIDRWGFSRLFLAASFAGLAAILAGGLLVSTDMRVRSVSHAWRLRSARS